MTRLGTAAWFQDLADRLNAKPEFAKNAKGFTVDIVFLVDDDRKTFFQIVDGVVLDVHPASPDEERDTEFVIESTPEYWAGLQSGKESARLGIMMGKIDLVRGSQVKLLKYLGAAGLIFDVMHELPTEL